MTVLTRNFKYCLISLTVILCSSCSGKEKHIEWHLIGNVPNSGSITMGFGTNDPTASPRDYTVKINKTNSIKHLGTEDKLVSLEKPSDFCLMTNYDRRVFDILEIYIFPNRNLEEFDGFYMVEPADFPVLYFIEGYDDEAGKNYYIVSKDNKIEKPKAIMDGVRHPEEMLDSFEEDFAYYNSDKCPISEVYNGYIVKSKNFGNYVFLSTLWGRFVFH